MNEIAQITALQEKVASQLRERLDQTGMSNRSLAEAIGVSDKTIGLFRSGARAPFPETLQKIADWLSNRSVAA